MKKKEFFSRLAHKLELMLNSTGLSLRAKLIIIFIAANLFSLLILAVMALMQAMSLGHFLRDASVDDSVKALGGSARENLERLTAGTAASLAAFLEQRNQDVLKLARLTPSEAAYRDFSETSQAPLMKQGEWVLAEDGRSWVEKEPPKYEGPLEISINQENEGINFNYRPPHSVAREPAPLYDEITFIDLAGNEIYKFVNPGSTKKHYPLNPDKVNVSDKAATYVKAETYFDELKNLKPGEIYVSEVIGAYVGTNYIGMYAPGAILDDPAHPDYDLLLEIAGLSADEFLEAARSQAYAGRENPVGRRFEGLIRWATPVSGEDGGLIGYVTMALSHDHIMEFADSIAPVKERPAAPPDAYASIRDHKCQSLAHPRHYTIAGYDPLTGEPRAPEGDEIEAEDRLEGRRSAPHCAGWMTLTEHGGSGSFHIFQGGLEKLTAAAAVPYYTGQYAPERRNGSKRGFALVAIGADLEKSAAPAYEMADKLTRAIDRGVNKNILKLILAIIGLGLLIALVAVALSSYLMGNIKRLLDGITRFSSGERQFRLCWNIKDEFGTLASSFDALADSIEISTDEPLVIIDMDRKFIYANQAALAIVGNKTVKEFRGKPYYDLSIYPPGSKYDPIAAFYENREAEVLLLEKTGQYKKGRARYLLDNHGRKAGYIIVTHDVTEIQHARRKAEEANRARGEFIAKMSHEIRTPMHAVIGMLEIVLREDLPAPIHDRLVIVKQASGNLLDIINSILDFSKIDSGKIELSPVDYRFSKFIIDVMNLIKICLMDKPVSFITNINRNIPDELSGDAPKIRQVLINILNNAVKYTAEGIITLTVNGERSDDGTVDLVIEIKDTGIGIKQEDIGKVFENFIQLNEEKNIEGTGLGLAITRGFVTLMEGSVGVESIYGAGSTFTVRLRQKVRSPKVLATVENPEKKSVLICEPLEIYANSIIFAMENVGVPYALYANEADFFEALATRTPAFVFIRPEMLAGLKARQAAPGRGGPKIVLFTEVEKIMADNDMGSLPVPINSISVASILNGLSPFDYAKNPSPAITFSAPEANVLVVDDIVSNLKVTEDLLRPYQMRVDLCASGQAALQALEDTKYDLVLMDHIMPEMDGLETTRRIRALSAEKSYCKNLPIIALTANALFGMKEFFLANGFVSYLTKPIDVSELNTVLEKWIPREKQKDPVPETETGQSGQEELDSGKIQVIEGLDIRKSLAILGCSIEAYMLILATFLRDGYKKIEQMKDCLETGNLPRYAVYVHALKSAASNVGAYEVSEMAKDLEEAAKRNDMAFIQAHDAKMIAALEALLLNIKSALEENRQPFDHVDISLLKTSLVKLEEAATDFDPLAVNEAADRLERFRQTPDISGDVEEILRSVLLGDYEEVLTLTKKLLRKMEG